ncbi:MAG TPA: response regulator [Nocardioidaceae bacterium]|nr:response regulator [Nocardioidaceae bacterium]
MNLGTLYRDIVEESPDGIWVIDAQGRTLYANPRVAELLGRSPEELEDLTVFDALDVHGRAQFAEHLRDLARGQVHAQDVECLWIRKDGGQLWVLVRESALYDDQGNVQGYLHRVTDYTERRRLFDELSRSGELLAEAQRIAKMGSYEWDIVNDVITASDELRTLDEVPLETYDGTYPTFLSTVHPDDRHIVDEAVAAALNGADEFDFTVRVVREGGVITWMRGRGEIVRDATGSPVRARGTHQDITDAKESELVLQDLVAQNTLMQVMASAANESETMIDLLGVAQPLLLHHDDWIRGRGYLPDPNAADGLTQLHLNREERDADALEPDLVAYERGLAVRSFRDRQQVWDEQTRPDRPVIAFPVMLRDEVAAVIVITSGVPHERHAMIRQMIDQVAVQIGRVAEREEAAKELAAARDGAMEASRQKSEFLATMSHEIRTPLNGVIGLNDLLLRTELDAHQQRLASGAQIASRALLGVINDILDFSKIEAGKLELENVEFEVRPVFDQVASVLGESARGKGLELLVSCHPDVPELLKGDPTRLAQVLTNLGSNAVKFTEQGEVFIRATAEKTRDGGTLMRVEVSDTGVGVDPDKREHIFDPFSQADASTTRRYGGTGLGLAISSEIVAALGGEIGLESSPGEGATFWFTARFGSAGSAPTDDALQRPRAALAGRRVLVVDDNAHNRLILSEHLGRWDVRAATAPGAVRALQMMRSAHDAGERFDAVLLDMVMPECDGMQLAAMVHADEHLAGTPLIMLTSSADAAAEELEKAGIRECLTKPVLAGDVLDALLRACDGAPAGRRTPKAATAAPAGRTSMPNSERPRLLVVEDNPVNQLVALGILETLGYAADTADDGLEGVEAWKSGSYAAVLMDVQMPRLDGYAATRTIRDLEPEGERIPVLAMTAAAVEGEREKCLAAGMDDFLSKPVDPEALGAVLRRWLSPDGREPTATVTTRDPHEGVLDHDRLDMLRDLDPGNTSYLDKAIANFVARVPESVHAIRTATAAHDHDGLTQAAHRLKGSALNLGLPTVGHLAHELEMLGDSGSTTGAGDVLADLEAALSRSVAGVLGYQAAYQQGALDPSRVTRSL